jgi:hypothetical protein
MSKTLLSPHFSLEEFTASDTALRRGIDNSLPPELMVNARSTAMMFERIRAHLIYVRGRPIPIILTSGYRCPELNRAIGSSDTSDHRKAMAGDARAPEFGTPYEVCQVLAPVVSLLNIGQLILEYGSWFHVSTRIPDKSVNRIITIDKRGTHVGIVQ